MQTTFHQYQKLYSTPHDMMHVPAKFGENTSMLFRVTVRKLNVTEKQTDRRRDGRTVGRGCCNISRPRAYGAAGDKNWSLGLISYKYRRNSVNEDILWGIIKILNHELDWAFK